MIYLLECDLKGTSPINRKIATGGVKVLPCNTILEYENHCKALLPNVGPNDLIVLDTLTSLLDTIRADFTFGLGTEAHTPWEQRFKWEKKKGGGDPEYLSKYDFAQQTALRWIKNLSARGARAIIVCHEAEVMLPVGNVVEKMQGPDVNKAFVGKLIGSVSDVYRLVSLTQPRVDGEGKEVLARDTRILYLRRTEEFVAKYACDLQTSMTIPDGIVNPTLPKLYAQLGTKPPKMLLYGHPGAGKTTFAMSEIEEPPLEKKETK